MAPFTSKAVIMHETTQASFVSGSSTYPFFSSFLIQGQTQMKDLRLASFWANVTSCFIYSKFVERASHLQYMKMFFSNASVRH